MIRAIKIAVPVTAVVLAFAVGAHATDTKAAVAEIEAHDKAFLAAYENGETKKMKSEIAKAVSLGEKSGLGADPVMADTYVLAAILEVDGNENTKAGVRDFVRALKIRRDVAIPKGMATSPVKAAFKQARAELGETPKEAATPAVAAEAPKAAAPEQKTADAKTAKQTEQQAKPDEKQAREDRERQASQEKQEKQEAQQKELALKEKAESDKQATDLKGRAQQLERDKADRDKQLADAKARAQQLEKDKADRDKQLADAKARTQQLEKDKADRDKQLADAKARIQQLEQQLEKDRADRDKQLGDARAQAAKDREALEKIARDKQAAEAQAKDAENKRKQAQQERERLFAGPEMPARLREALTCAVPDEAPLRADLFVHCVARPNLKARSIVFYYRAGSARYTSVPMERTAKGWYAALVPGVHVTGKVLQYYAEALDGREAVVANNGKEASPNILSLHAGGPRS
jgi:hypothetical protein